MNVPTRLIARITIRVRYAEFLSDDTNTNPTIPGYQSRGESGANPFADVVALLHLLRRSSPAALSSTTRRRRRAFILCQSRRRGQAAAEYMESGICSCFRGLDHPALLSAFLLCNRLVVVPSMHRSRNLSRGRPSRWSFRFLMSCPRASHGTTPFLSADCYRLYALPRFF